MRQADWNEEDWIDTMHRAIASQDHNIIRRLRFSVWESTIEFVQKGSYLANRKEVKLDLTEDVEGNSLFYDQEVHIPSSAPRFESTQVRVIVEDSLNAAHKMVGEGKEPCVLNMANRQNPGGGVRNGASAQEEDLFRRSDYFRFLYRYQQDNAKDFGIETDKKHSYPLDRNFGGVYSDSVTVFRSDEKNGYALLSQPYKVSMVAVAAINSPEVVDGRISPELVLPTINKIRTILRIAYLNGHQHLVLSAFGCGAFRNPPSHMAELFKQVLQEDEFNHRFVEIVFAILKRNDKTYEKGNYECFKEVFGESCTL
ncbi:MAG: TIGR02452 family protein [Paludibacteraceae bacterium]|nr:TIGR02452 family protein [Paludibacteraceae bacterium]